MKDRPLIGINTDYRAIAKGRTPHSFMHSGYYDCLLAANALPVIIPPLTQGADLAPILDRLDGVMLTGGDDLDPQKMGLSPHPSVTVMPERRELADRLLCKLVQQRRMPVLGIGLGMQELNVVYGGGIFLHLPEDMPKGIPHRDPQGGASPHRRHGAGHPARGDLRARARSGSTATTTRASASSPRTSASAALAPDGLIEAFEGKDPAWWVVGVQWHPENEGNISLDMQLIEAFIAAAASMQSSPALAKVG